MATVITAGVEYTQLLEDIGAIVRYAMDQHSSTSSPAQDATPAEELLSIREGSKMLGVTVQTVHEWKRRGLLKYYKLGSRSYLKRVDVLAALQDYHRSTKAGKGGPRG